MDFPDLQVRLLPGRMVRLEPLSIAHVDGLIDAAAENRESYSYTTVPQGRAGVAEYVQTIVAAAERGETFGFAQVRVTDGAPVGATRFLNLRGRAHAAGPYAVEVGGTWLAASAQRTGLNVEAKLLLLTYAFEEWRVGRVDFLTDARNARSRAAIAALGAEFEGVLRNGQVSRAAGEEGLLRDSALYSIVEDDWTAVRAGLLTRSTNRRR